ncbi:helix-turn-helix transcriptional regulator [Jannaschia sp. M317]|uniref:ArsR/SmtB family transcription factor n=1 Tax=Jannaschia sp. M317 TaxID=2867011 RepID=UPI0021A7484D|nr:metalloregulator ArsR/SmtB family transcription factor [Jannaschia sp. M317]UWQ17819.1 metalloregulator ArsR/SmtB family transcription factor [Jannaschia sp. M317]
MTDHADSARALAALGHEARLHIFRFLVRAGQGGATVGQIAAHLDLPASTLAHHLRSLVTAGLLTQERQGREVVTRVAFDRMTALLDFLTAECCSGIAAPRDVA